MKELDYYYKKGQIEAADAIYGELEDGAYWAICEETGVGQGVQLAVDEYEREHKLGVYAAPSPDKADK